MSGQPGSWDAVPSPAPGGDGREARVTPPTSADGRVHGRPAPQYGEYAPEGWVNPVLVEQERQAAEQRRLEAAQAAAASGRAPQATRADRPTGARPPGRTAAAGPATRLGASPGDLLLTVLLLAFGLVSVVQQLAVGDVASTIAQTLEQRYTALQDPGALLPAAIVNAIVGVVVLALVVWWSVVRLRRGKRTFWVPLLGGVVASVFTGVLFMAVAMQDGHFAAYLLQHGGA